MNPVGRPRQTRRTDPELTPEQRSGVFFFRYQIFNFEFHKYVYFPAALRGDCGRRFLISAGGVDARLSRINHEFIVYMPRSRLLAGVRLHKLKFLYRNHSGADDDRPATTTATGQVAFIERERKRGSGQANSVKDDKDRADATGTQHAGFGLGQ